jgi:peroxiredoxin
MSAGKKTGYWLIGLVIVVGILAVLWASNKAPTSPPQSRNLPVFDHVHIPAEPPEVKSPAPVTANSTPPVITEKSGSIKIKDIINSKERRGWSPVLKSWYGKPAPDFVLPDINGKKHKLSDYRGKDVIVLFWATWCVPCLEEIPHLVALRNIYSEEKLAILAISNENPTLLKKFIAGTKINYTILASTRSTLPSPFRLVLGIPTSFFVDKEGKIKIVTQGSLYLGETKLILQAE